MHRSLGVMQGVVWFGGNVMYGIGSQLLGSLGLVAKNRFFPPSYVLFIRISSDLMASLVGRWVPVLSLFCIDLR